MIHTFQNWVSLPENQSARAAVARVVEGVCRRRVRSGFNPLFLHGPSGTGKSHLARTLVRQPTTRCPDLIVSTLGLDAVDEDIAAARDADMVVVEDVHRFSSRPVDSLAALVDRCRNRRRQLVVTATTGPAELTHLSGRLTSRLACGLVVGLLPLAPSSRRLFLQDRLRRRKLHVPDDVLNWLTEHLPGSGRQLEGALVRLEKVLALHAPLSVALVAEQFQTEADKHRPTVERIAQRVADYFQMKISRLRGRLRSRDVLLPRQVGMYLARQLTALPLQQIGAFFGGRDHSTVLHACRKVEAALKSDDEIGGTVRQLHADLG